jgi:hypothetical protein
LVNPAPGEGLLEWSNSVGIVNFSCRLFDGTAANGYRRTLWKSESYAQHHCQDYEYANPDQLQETTKKFSQPHLSIVQLFRCFSDITKD